MKKYFILAASAIAFASCTNDEFVGEPSPSTEPVANNEAILFRSATSALTRAEGSAAATLLDNNFVVEGVKYVSSEKKEVFDHYNVNWVDGTANTTASNTKNWEYVAQDQNIKGTSAKLSSASAQTIKYWDYAASQYDFVAVSLGKGVGTTPTYAELSDIDYEKIGTDVVYTLTGTTQELAAAYIADLVSVYNTASHREFNTGAVTPKFRSLGTKIRFAFYETVPGYSVSGLTFYNAGGTSGANATLHAATAVYPSAGNKGVMSISFPTVGESNISKTDYNKAHVSFVLDGSGTATADVTIGALNYQTAPELGEATAKYLGRTSATATYALPAGATAPTTEGANAAYYEVVLPYETGAALNLKVDYTLTSTDGSGETIKVSGATAVVPQVYTKWMPNYAYTYIFKISQNTNGLTDPSQTAAGLYPITFDAVITETTDGIQETVTTVSTPSITTYAKGVNPTATAEYATGSNIYVMVDNGEALTVDTNAKLYTVKLEATDYIYKAVAGDALDSSKTYYEDNDGTDTPHTITGTENASKTYYEKLPASSEAAQTINEASVANTLANGGTSSPYSVKDANGWTMTVTSASGLTAVTQIEAGDAPNGNAIAINGVKFTPTVAGTYAFQYVVAAKDAVLYASADEYNSDKGYSSGDTGYCTDFSSLSDAEKIKTPAVEAQNQIKIIIVH